MLDDSIIVIPLTQEQYTIIDAIDADLAELKWCAHRHHTRGFYADRETRASGKRTTAKLHRIILSRILNRALSSDEQCDHINLDKLDNRRGNLRLATRTQNKANSPKYSNNKSGYKGVSWSNSNKKWHAQIRNNNKVINLGFFDDPKDAYEAYCKTAEQLFGEFSRFE